MSDARYPNLVIIVAVARNGIIGCTDADGRAALPWHLPEDLQHFKATTSGHPIIMGRKTWVSLGRALPNRRNIVITHQPDYAANDAEVFGSLPAALAAVGEATAFIIGGAEIYRQALPLAARLIVTEVGIDADGDTRFPALDPGWVAVSRHSHVSATGLPYALVRYEREGSVA